MAKLRYRLQSVGYGVCLRLDGVPMTDTPSPGGATGGGNTMKTLYIIRGLPGSGKSTLAGYLCQGIKAQVCEADRYFTANDGVYKFDPSRLPDAHAYCQAICEELMVDGTPFLAVSNTFSRRWEMEPYRELARKYGYEVTVIEVQTSLSDEQLAERNVHGVHKDAIARMRARWENLRG